MVAEHLMDSPKSEQDIATSLSDWNPHVLFVTQCTLVKGVAMYSCQMQCILVKSDEFENWYSFYIFFLNPDFVAAHWLRSLRGNDVSIKRAL